MFNNVSNLIVFAAWRTSCRKFTKEAELEAVGCAVKYDISKNTMKTIFWTYCKGLVEGFYENVTYVNTNLLYHMDRLKLTYKKYRLCIIMKK